MKKLTFLLFTCVLAACSAGPDTTASASLVTEAHRAGTGKCTKCGCQGWRGDSEEPERCINIRYPTKDLCQHLASDHR